MAEIKFVVAFLLILEFSKPCCGQQLLGKNEIYNDWVKSHSASTDCDASIDQLSFDAKSEAQIQATVQSLRSKGVDTLLVLVNSHPGVLIADTCRSSNYPGEVYIFWRVGGKESVRKIPNKCGLNGVESSCYGVFDFFFSTPASIRTRVYYACDLRCKEGSQQGYLQSDYF